MCEEITGDEIRIYSSIIAGPEHGADKAVWLCRIPEPIKRYSISSIPCFAHKTIGAFAIKPLLLLKCFHYERHGCHPLCIERGRIPCFFPVAICKAYGIAEAVYL